MKRLLILLLLVTSISAFGQINERPKHHHHQHDEHDDEDEDDDDGCLPVDLIQFVGHVDKKTIKLVWSTATETNNDYYSIFKSPNGFEYWELVGTIQGVGNSTVQSDYEYVDKDPYNGINYYVLMQTDFNGNRKQYDPIGVLIALPPEYNLWDHYNFLGQEIK